MGYILLAGLAVAAVALIFAKSFIFGWLREYLGNGSTALHYIAYELITCPFCLSFWASAPLALFYESPLGARPIDLFVTWFALSTLGTIFAFLIIYLGRQASSPTS
jgi:hypothetical protein